MADVVLTVLVVVVQVILAFLGVRVTLHPPNTKKEKLQYKVGFVVLALVAGGISVIQTYRAGETQKKNEALLHQIESDSRKTSSTMEGLGKSPLKIQVIEDEKIKRHREIREQLGEFIKEGTVLRERAMRNDPKVKADWVRWKTKVGKYLRENLGASYEQRFKTMEISGMMQFQTIMAEIQALLDIIPEFKD